MKRKIEPYQPDYKNINLQTINDVFLSEIVRSAKHAKELNAEIVELRKIIDDDYITKCSLERELKSITEIVDLFDDAMKGDSPDLEKLAEIKDKHLDFRISFFNFDD